MDCNIVCVCMCVCVRAHASGSKLTTEACKRVAKSADEQLFTCLARTMTSLPSKQKMISYGAPQSTLDAEALQQEPPALPCPDIDQRKSQEATD